MGYTITTHEFGEETSYSLHDESGNLYFIKYNTGDMIWFDSDGSINRIHTHDDIEINCHEYSTIDEWYNSLSYIERKSILNDLHFARHEIEKTRINKFLRQLISRIEELHDNYKERIGYLP